MKIKRVSIFLLLLVLIPGLFYFIQVFNSEPLELNDNLRKEFGGTYIKLSDGVTHYKFVGDKNAQLVVLVHGGTVPSWTWDNQASFLVKAGYRVLTYDKFGRGYSDRPDVIYNKELYQRQLYELIEKLDISQAFHLIGISLGGATAAKFAAKNPKRVGKLILISPVISNFKINPVFSVPILGEIMAYTVGIKVIVNRFNSLYGNKPDLKKYQNLYFEQTTIKGFRSSLLSMLRNDALGDYSSDYKKLGLLNKKILLLWGIDDTEITKIMIDDIHEFIPNIEFIPVMNAGHGIIVQQADKVNGLLLNFLQQ